MVSHVKSKKIQQTGEYNKKEAGSQIKRMNWWLPVTGADNQGVEV